MRPFILMYLILVLFTSGLLAQTIRMNNSATGRNYSVQHQGQSVLPLLQEADRNYKTFQYEGTLFTLDEAVNQNPNSAEALLLRARFKRKVGMLAEAEADYQRANRLNPYVANLFGYNGSSDLLNILSIAPAETMTSLSSFQKLNYYYPILDTKMISGRYDADDLVLLEEVISQIEFGQFEAALNGLNTIEQNNPGSAISHDLRGLILLRQENYEEAIQSFSRAVTLEPDFAISWYNFAQVERKLGNLDTAKQYLDKAIALQGDLTKAYFERALVLKSMGEKEKALEDYNTVIELQGEQYMEAFLNRGLTRKMLGDYAGALVDLNKAIEEFPENPGLFKNRGNVHMLFGLHLKAIDDYTEAIHLNSEYAEAYYNRALAHFLNYDKVSGCYDLEKSAALGFEKAKDVQVYFCGTY